MPYYHKKVSYNKAVDLAFRSAENTRKNLAKFGELEEDEITDEMMEIAAELRRHAAQAYKCVLHLRQHQRKLKERKIA